MANGKSYPIDSAITDDIIMAKGQTKKLINVLLSNTVSRIKKNQMNEKK